MHNREPALKISGLEKVYSSGLVALKGIDLEVQQGDFYALLGPNGAGKSTTIGIISSLVTKTRGTVEVFGIDIDLDFPRAKSMIGLVPQELNFSQFETVLDIVVNQAGYYGLARGIALERAKKYLTALALWDRKDEVSRNLSGGMKRRLMIARALIHEPKLLILDEPTAGVDIEIRRSMWKFLRDLNASGTSIILTTHYLEEAEQLCRNIAIIDGGEIIENTSMRHLLAQMQSESFVCDCDGGFESLSENPLATITPIDDHTLEITVEKNQSLNSVFEQLSRSGITIKSMRNKSNRLEELFVELVSADD